MQLVAEGSRMKERTSWQLSLYASMFAFLPKRGCFEDFFFGGLSEVSLKDV